MGALKALHSAFKRNEHLLYNIMLVRSHGSQQSGDIVIIVSAKGYVWAKECCGVLCFVLLSYFLLG